MQANVDLSYVDKKEPDLHARLTENLASLVRLIAALAASQFLLNYVNYLITGDQPPHQESIPDHVYSNFSLTKNVISIDCTHYVGV